MKSVTDTTHANLRGKWPTMGQDAAGNLSDVADFYPRHVLVVDDEPLIRRSVSDTVSDAGYDVQQAPATEPT